MKRLFVIIAVFVYGVFANAQDIHFSQFYNSPLTLNPALTGKLNGAYRIGFIYRNQWFQASPTGVPFMTYSASFDMPFRFKNDAVGVGLMAYQDNQGEGFLKTLNVMASGSYHKGLGKEARHSIGIGVQLGYMQKRVDFDNRKFERQYVGTIYDPNRSNGENFGKDSKGLFDLNVGLFWNSMLGKRSAIYAGGAMFHVLAPENNFVQNVKFNMPRRYVGHGGADIGIGNKFSILPSVIYMYQDKASELNAGAALAYAFTESFSWYLGGFYRLKDAPIAYTAFELKGFRLGLSYDFVTSDLREINKPGAIELSLLYIGKPKTLPNPSSILFCPRF
jgi:type IX secretion system PorP/SprF family membrane protein